MEVEIDNILRAITDIRRAIFAMEPKLITADQVLAFKELTESVDGTEFAAHALQYELKESKKIDESEDK